MQTFRSTPRDSTIPIFRKAAVRIIQIPDLGFGFPTMTVLQCSDSRPAEGNPIIDGYLIAPGIDLRGPTLIMENTFRIQTSASSDLWRVLPILMLLCLALPGLALPGLARAEDYPRYKPASRNPEPMDIRTNAYGASRSAPEALRIGDTAPDFVAPRAGGGSLSLQAMRASGPVALIFYRGHW